MQLLVQHGCQLDSVDAENRTALRAAAWSGHEEIVKILLQHGANVNLTDHEVSNPLTPNFCFFENLEASIFFG